MVNTWVRAPQARARYTHPVATARRAVLSFCVHTHPDDNGRFFLGGLRLPATLELRFSMAARTPPSNSSRCIESLTRLPPLRGTAFYPMPSSRPGHKALSTACTQKISIHTHPTPLRRGCPSSTAGVLCLGSEERRRDLRHGHN